MKWNLILPAIDEIPIIRGAGVPTGTPPFNGARYLNTTTGVIWLGRNVLTAQSNTNIAFPTASTARAVTFRFKHNDPSPSVLRQFHNANGSPVNRLALVRSATTGNITASGLTPSQIVLDGATITSGTTNPSANEWHKISLSYTSDGAIDRIFNLSYIGEICDFVVSDASSVARNFAIDEGSGSTIIDSSGNGQNGTLTLGSGSWELTWVPQN